MMVLAKQRSLLAIAAAILATGCALGECPCLRYRRACQENLASIDAAKKRWAADHGGKPGDPLVEENILAADGKPGSLKKIPSCPSGGVYLINPVGQNPVCASGLIGHSLTEIGLDLPVDQ